MNEVIRIQNDEFVNLNDLILMEFRLGLGSSKFVNYRTSTDFLGILGDIIGLRESLYAIMIIIG